MIQNKNGAFVLDTKAYKLELEKKKENAAAKEAAKALLLGQLTLSSTTPI